MTLTKAELIDSLIEDTDLQQKEAKAFVDSFYDELISALENGFDIRLSSFGNFILRDKSPRPGRNPKTGEDVTISARRVVTFKPGQKMKTIVQDNLSS
ncbi:integration host factor subunit alpha [Francisellaceae bacterium]|nr:integration host factor subunit alpha [Francisellaceae bacterium]